MKKQLLILAALAFLCSCGAGDDKNEAENYPTYDTSANVNTINDSAESEDLRSEGELRHNIDSDNDGR